MGASLAQEEVPLQSRMWQARTPCNAGGQTMHIDGAGNLSPCMLPLVHVYSVQQ